MLRTARDSYARPTVSTWLAARLAYTGICRSDWLSITRLSVSTDGEDGKDSSEEIRGKLHDESRDGAREL